MPILKDDDGKAMVLMGSGDIEVAHGRRLGDDRPTELILLESLDGPHDIGQSNPHYDGSPTSVFPAGVRIRFDRPESLVIFIGKAVELLDKMMIPAPSQTTAETTS